MADISIRISGRAGRITLNRPDALNALTYDMALKIEAALMAWRNDDAVELVVIDATGERAFCAGGDIQEMYRTGMAGDFAYGRKFWSDEYRLNALIADYPKPYVSLMHGFTMGGGVGVSAHGSHRIVCENSQIAMPECGIGLVPDVGGSLLLARAPGAVGVCLGLTGGRMGPGDAIFVGFADHFVPQEHWPDLLARLEETGDVAVISAFAEAVPTSPVAAEQPHIDRHFGRDTLRDIAASLATDDSDWAERTRKALSRPSPLSMACTVEIIRRVGQEDTIHAALEQEYRFTHRCMEHGDFLEGIRAQVIDKDRSPKWRHGSIEAVSEPEIADMLRPVSQ